MTRHAEEDCEISGALIEAGYFAVHYDFDRDAYSYVWWPFAPFAVVAYWWRYDTPWRWAAERWMNRRVCDKRDGECHTFACHDAVWRSLRDWSWRHTPSRAQREADWRHEGYNDGYKRGEIAGLERGKLEGARELRDRVLADIDARYPA